MVSVPRERGCESRVGAKSRSSDLEVACTSDHFLRAVLQRSIALLDLKAKSSPVTVESEAMTRYEAQSTSFHTLSQSSVCVSASVV